jgi:hypothetical protein
MLSSLDVPVVVSLEICKKKLADILSGSTLYASTVNYRCGTYAASNDRAL